MKKLFLVCLLMLAGSAWAEWVVYTNNDEATFYFDPSTIRKDGNLRRVWELHDFRRRDKDGEMSLRTRQEYDCKQERQRFLGGSTHSEPMAGGKPLRTAGESNDWDGVAPGTVGERMLNLVCAK